MNILFTRHAEAMLVEREIDGVLRSEPEKMKTHYDMEADALYVRFADAKIIDSEEVAPGPVLDFDADHRIVGLEVLNARRHLAEGAELPTAAE